jgi:hypothetical protein
MNEQQKRSVLANLGTYEMSELHQFIVDGEFTLEDYINSNRLPKAKQIELESLLKEETEWRKACDSDTRGSYLFYISLYPQGKYISQANASIERKKKEEEEEKAWNKCKQVCNDSENLPYESPVTEKIGAAIEARDSVSMFLTLYRSGRYSNEANGLFIKIMVNIAQLKGDIIQDMKTNPNRYNANSLKQLLRGSVISKEDLFNEDIITETHLTLFLNPPTFFMPQDDWKDLPPLPAMFTDVYFFGIPASGKSCVLAGMLFKALEAGVLEPLIDNPMGLRYMNELIRCIEVGYVPPSTSVDTVNYISFKLRGKQDHPISVIEMSGEYFNKTYEKGTGQGNSDGIYAKQFLKNNNRKTIFFVIDYSADIHATSISDAATQGAKLMYALQLLEQDGTLRRTDSINIILSKSDLMPEGVDRKTTARMFIDMRYKAFYKLANEKCNKYGINRNNKYEARIIPFSLGRFMLGKTFEKNLDNSTELVNILLNDTLIIRKRRWYNI